jgi:hypothetical protein
VPSAGAVTAGKAVDAVAPRSGVAVVSARASTADAGGTDRDAAPSDAGADATQAPGSGEDGRG